VLIFDRSARARSFAKSSGVAINVKILLAFLVVAASMPTTEARAQPAKPILPLDFAHPISRTEMLKLMPSPPIDSFYDWDARGKSARVLVFAPVTIAGINSVVHIMFVNDTVDQTNFYLPYRPRNGLKPVMPYGTQRFTKANIDDLVHLREALTKLYGEPAVFAETSFIYFGGPNVPHMMGIFKDATVLFSIFPSE